MTELYHFSEDSTIRRFRPHVPATNPQQPPAVWAIDAAHAPLYWFPRDCPRAAVWARDPSEQEKMLECLSSPAHRVHAFEADWLDRVREVELYAYVFDSAAFRPWEEADGQYLAEQEVEPQRVETIRDLLDRHVQAGIELRIVSTLGPLCDTILASGLPFSFVRLRNARR